MNFLIDFTKNEMFGVVMLALLLINFIMLIVLAIKFGKTAKEYKKFMKKLGKGVNLESMLREYIDGVEDVKKSEKEIRLKCKEIERNVERCIQKVGIIRYNAFDNTGSDLCFSVALLDFEDSGVILSGIYSRDNTTTTYAKPIEKGKSKYTLTKEEEQALRKGNGASSK